MSVTKEQPIASPCVRKCCLNADDICLGCFRSLQEIIQWTQVDDAMRIEYLNNANIRRSHINTGWAYIGSNHNNQGDY